MKQQGATQRSFEELGTPLSEVTFCVVDLETTGGSPQTSSISEIGALKIRCGQVLGSFATLVHPDEPVPAFVRLLTGISNELVADAPAIEAVLPSFLEFLRDAVVVAHNARFDVGFLNAALVRLSYPPLANPVVDTAALARKVLAGEVRDHKLDTLARHFRCAHHPNHRAFPDVLATVDVLHGIIERAAGFGVTTFEDLVGLSSSRMDGTFPKIQLATGLPAGPGVYRFLGVAGQTLYVGKATDIRSRVRSYFYGDPRRRTASLLRETQSITAEPHATLLEAEVAEARAIVREQPPYNRAGKRIGEWYLKLALNGRAAKVSSARVVKEDGAVYAGPLGSIKATRMLIDALRDALEIHRCAEPAHCRGCAFSDLGRCSGRDAETHRQQVGLAVAALQDDPGPVLDAIVARMARLAREERYEEAAETRDRGAAFEGFLARHFDIGALRSAGDVVFAVDERVFQIREAQLEMAADIGPDGRLPPGFTPSASETSGCAPLTAEQDRGARAVTSWLRRHLDEVRLVAVEGTWAMPTAARPTRRFAPSGRDQQ
ncbi:MAG: DEDD exonuclease domain-containing protein [Actinomycetota bacterium]|nr:DEDD exonuclease domain-containing protein [Actinomycetota bacterium]